MDVEAELSSKFASGLDHQRASPASRSRDRLETTFESYRCSFGRITRWIIFSPYPGHTTHLLQPLDVGLLAPLQKAYGAPVHDYTGTHWHHQEAALQLLFTGEANSVHQSEHQNSLASRTRRYPTATSSKARTETKRWKMSATLRPVSARFLIHQFVLW